MTDITKTQDYIELKQKFDAYYAEKLQPILADSNRIRHRYNLSFATLILMSLILYPTILYFLLTNKEGHGYMGAILAVSCLVIMFTLSAVRK